MDNSNEITPKGAPANPTRRTFIEVVIAVLGAGIAFAVGIPVVGALLSPLTARADKEKWVTVGPAEQFPEGKTVRTVYKRVKRDGWMESESSATVFITRKGEEYRVLSSICTHLGCSVNWEESANRFHCPCHNGLYAPDGKVIGGPPPRPLTLYQARVTSGQLEVLEA